MTDLIFFGSAFVGALLGMILGSGHDHPGAGGLAGGCLGMVIGVVVALATAAHVWFVT
jgi:hypothetical protein